LIGFIDTFLNAPFGACGSLRFPGELQARPARIEPLLTTVMRGLDPRIHLLAKRMDCRVKPGNDNRFNMTGNRFNVWFVQLEQ
jgi:hypothetical protein